MAIPLTPTAIDAIRPNGKRQEIRFKGKGAAGLQIRVGAAGGKRWGFWKRIPSTGQVYRASRGEVVLLGNGKVDPMDIENALTWAAEQRKIALGGVNLATAKREAKGAPKMEDMWEEYFRDHASVKKAVSSQQADERIWRNHLAPEFGGMKVADIDRQQVKTFYSRKLKELRAAHGGSGGMANNIIALLSKIMEEAISSSYRESNPCRGIKKVRVKTEWPSITDTQRNAILSASDKDSPAMGLIVAIALKTGARKQEILKAQWRNIQNDEWLIPRTKAGIARTVKLPPVLLSRMLEWKEEEAKNATASIDGWVFPSPQKAGQPREDVKSAWQRVRHAAGVPHLRFHDLRHDFGTQSARAGMSPFDLMQAMGHARIETTMLYINRAALDGRGKVTASREVAIEASKDTQGTSQDTVVNLRP